MLPKFLQFKKARKKYNTFYVYLIQWAKIRLNWPVAEQNDERITEFFLYGQVYVEETLCYVLFGTLFVYRFVQRRLSTLFLCQRSHFPEFNRLNALQFTFWKHLKQNSVLRAATNKSIDQVAWFDWCPFVENFQTIVIQQSDWLT